MRAIVSAMRGGETLPAHLEAEVEADTEASLKLGQEIRGVVLRFLCEQPARRDAVLPAMLNTAITWARQVEGMQPDDVHVLVRELCDQEQGS